LWRLDLAKHELISPAGLAISLTGREMILMQHLAETRQGATVPRATFSEILGYRMLGPESRSLDAVLRRLRQKATDRGFDLPLHSVHALGIRFSASLCVM
jgi:two-component system torCAD operon response regulator TorR